MRFGRNCFISGCAGAEWCLRLAAMVQARRRLAALFACPAARVGSAGPEMAC
jgi:hypothetical protein